MKTAIILFAVAVFIASYADGRVYYLENLENVRNNAIYPGEQASRDLDLAFSAGDPVETENVVSPTRKVYTLVTPEKPYVELGRDADRPIAYKLIEPAATRRGNFDDVILVPSQGGRKLMKLNDNNKGEVILELRVIANHDST
ncbi:uncharacterized protein [Anoplolepis gracilipes]|uniref:uncharacterized protein n=1 Tax=Anoplolepis gracilipes TaxID=354296 RepID=UPI003BA39FD0